MRSSPAAASPALQATRSPDDSPDAAPVDGAPPLPPLRPLTYAPPPGGALRAIHVDADVLVIDKPSGLLAVPGKTPDLADCVEARARAAFPDALTIHRLDLDTSGVLLMARNRRAQRILGLQFERRMIGKTYVARVAGLMAADAGVIDLALGSDWPNRPRQMVDRVRGRRAITEWQALSRDASPNAPSGGVTRVALRPLTGRTHQLRVHLRAIGHPILGDALYAPEPAFAAAPRLQLHAETLSFRHPRDGTPTTFRASPPF